MSETGKDLAGLLRELRPRLRAILSSFRIPPQDSDDLLQNVCLQYLRKRKQIRDPSHWLPGALRNECRMYLRTQSRRFTVAVDDALLDLMGADGEPQTTAQEQAVLRRNLTRWIAQLDRRCRQILLLRYHLGHETREVAEATGYRPSSVDKVTRRCLDALGRKVVAALPTERRTP